MGEGREGGGRARRSKPPGLARRRGCRARLGDRKGQSRSLSHEGEGLFQVRRQRLTLTADDDKQDVEAPPPKGRGRLRFDDVKGFDLQPPAERSARLWRVPPTHLTDAL